MAGSIPVALAAFRAEMEAERTDPAARLDHDDTRGRCDDDARRDDHSLAIAHARAHDTGYFPVPADAAAAFGPDLHREQHGQHRSGENIGNVVRMWTSPPGFGFEHLDRCY
jgi:hypothetical protein